MPVGPSHGSRSSGGGGGGRSSFGGGSSFSRSYGGGSRYYHRPRGPRTVVFFGSPRVISPKRGSVLSFLFVIAVFALVFSIIFMSSVSDFNNKVKQMEKDAPYYLALKEEGDGVTHVRGRIEDYVYYHTYDGTEWYYIEYTYFVEGESIEREGETYAVYSMSQIKNMGSIGGSIDIGYAYDENGDLYSMDYKKYQLENPEYLYYKEQYSKKVTAVIISAVVLVVIIGIAIATVATAKKKEEEAKIEKAEQERKVELSKYCQYCGTKIEDGNKKCGGCGASLK